jgi:uncharacterized protein (DUF1800 family)
MREQYPTDKRPARIVAELQTARMLRAVASERQLQELMIDFWFNHFNVFANKGEVRWYVTAYERDVIRPTPSGRFPELLRATARHPAMLFYLDNWLSVRPGYMVRGGPNQGRLAGLNENYARELMELHTLGVDGGYSQSDVTEVARAFTGWTIERPRQDARYVFRPATHDFGDKRVLGRVIRVRRRARRRAGARHAGRHPSTARFIAGKLPPVREPTSAAGADRARGGRYGHRRRHPRHAARDLRGSRSSCAPETAGAKIKKPSEFVGQRGCARSGATVDARGAVALARASAEIGEGLYEAAAAHGLSGPGRGVGESGRAAGRMNFALALADGRRAGVRVDVGALVAAPTGRRPEVVLERLLAALIHGAPSAETARGARRAARHAGDHAVEHRRSRAREHGREQAGRAGPGSPEFQRR